MSTCELNSSDVLQHESYVFQNEKSFHSEVGVLLEACKSEHSQVQSKDFYIEKIKSLHKNHIQVLLEERKKCDRELDQAQFKRKKNRLLIIKRLEAIANALNLLKGLNKCSGLLLNNFIVEQRNIIKDIRSKLEDSVCCDMYLVNMKKDAKKERKTIRRDENTRRQLLQAEKELKKVKSELKYSVNTIRKHTDFERERSLEISKLKEDVNSYKIQLTQAQNFREVVCKELIDEISVVQPSLENSANGSILMTDTESGFEEARKDSDNSNISSNSARSRQKGIIYLNDAEEANMASEQVAVTQSQPQAFHKENSASATQVSFNLEEKDRAELSKLQTYLAKTPQVLEVAKKIVSSKINIIQHEQKTMEQLNEAEEDVRALRNQLAQTQNELETVKKELNEKIQIIQQKPLPEQKEMELCTVKTVELLQSQLIGTQQAFENVKKALSSKINIIAQKVQHEQKIKKQLNKSEEDKKILQDQLAQTHNKLENVKKELNKEIELRKSKEDGLLQFQLTLAHKEIEATRKCVDYNLNLFMQKNQHAQKLTKELSEAEENVKLLRSQLAETRHVLETVRKEFNDKVNVIQQEHIEKEMEIELSNIQLILINKLGATDKNDQHFENYMKERSSRGIVSDIQRLIEDKVQLRNENIPEAVIHSNILQVTENELHLLILVASVLKVVPFSASTDFIYSFVAEVDNVISRQHVENLLRKYPTLFKEESVGAGSSNKNWSYLYLKPIITI